jgi:6-phosphogluconolactonase
VSDSGVEVRLGGGREETAAAVAADVVTLVAAAVQSGAEPRIVLTGGSVAREVHREIAARAQGLDWSRVTMLWGDERFLPAGHEDRNEAQADQDLLAHLPLNPARVLRAPDSDQTVDVQAAAATYGSMITSLLADDPPEAPAFDLVMLGIGADGHVASLFPGHRHPSDPVVAVTDAPKPPPQRVSLGPDLLGRSRQVWFVAVGHDKAEAVAAAVRRDPPDLPAARVRGLDGTRVYVDPEAFSQLRG